MTPTDIKMLRKQLGLSADEFAEYFGLTGVHRARTAWAWEKGKLLPSKERREHMRKVYHMIQKKEKR